MNQNRIGLEVYDNGDVLKMCCWCDWMSSQLWHLLLSRGIIFCHMLSLFKDASTYFKFTQLAKIASRKSLFFHTTRGNFLQSKYKRSETSVHLEYNFVYKYDIVFLSLLKVSKITSHMRSTFNLVFLRLLVSFFYLSAWLIKNPFTFFLFYFFLVVSGLVWFGFTYYFNTTHP